MIFATAGWVYLWYLLSGFLGAGLMCACIISLGLLTFKELREVEIQEPEPDDLLDYDEALKCKGRLPHPKYYEDADVSDRRAA